MSDSQNQSWSDNPNAPKISHSLYVLEKAYFAGILLLTMLYGMLIILFFKCMAALLNPVHRKRGGIKWGYIVYTLVMFSVATVVAGMQLHDQSIAYIDNRDYKNPKGGISGPFGFQLTTVSGPLSLVPNTFFFLNYWLADGLLLFRCYIFYSKNLWVIALPFLMYLGSISMGILMLYQFSGSLLGPPFTLSYYSVSVSLNVLLTLMIVVRLVMYGRNIHAATGSTAGIGGLYKTISTMLIESSAIYAVNSLVFIGLYARGSSISYVFLCILTETEVIAPLLIIQRVANNSALTNETVVAGAISTFEAGSRTKSMGDSGTFPPLSYVDERGTNSSGLGYGVETGIDFRRDGSKV